MFSINSNATRPAVASTPVPSPAPAPAVSAAPAAAPATIVPAAPGAVGPKAAALIPEGFVTHNSGFEVLGTNWDVYAEASPEPVIDVVEHQPAAGISALPLEVVNAQLRARIVALEQQLHETNIRHKSIMDAVNLQATAARDRLYEADRHRREDEVIRAQQTQELEMMRKDRQHLQTVFKQIQEVLICPICTEVALLPKILGSCGHIACQNCLKQLDDVAFASLTSAVGGASARQHLLARRCPQCRVEIIGAGFPCLPLKQTASILVMNGHIEVPEMASVQKHLEFNAISYEKESVEARHIHALQLGCYAQSQLAQHSVSCVIATVTPEQWTNGVYILFESAVSRVFFETFATTLHGKAGGVNVLVNAQQRMLAVQLLDKGKNKKPNESKAEGHLLIKVATDGRFTMSTTPDPKAAEAAAVAIAPAAAAPAGGPAITAAPPVPPTFPGAETAVVGAAAGTSNAGPAAGAGNGAAANPVPNANANANGNGSGSANVGASNTVAAASGAAASQPTAQQPTSNSAPLTFVAPRVSVSPPRPALPSAGAGSGASVPATSTTVVSMSDADYKQADAKVKK